MPGEFPWGTAGATYNPSQPQWLRECRVCRYQWVTQNYQDVICPACNTGGICPCNMVGPYCIAWHCARCDLPVYGHKNTEMFWYRACKNCVRKIIDGKSGSEVTRVSSKSADFTSISTTGETVSHDGKNTVYRIVASGKDGSIGVQGTDHNLLMDAIERAQGDHVLKGGVTPAPAPKKAIAPPVIRIGDAERRKTTDALGEHMAEGRINLSEFQARADKAVAATSQAELDALVKDLPVVAPPVPWQAQELVTVREELTRSLAERKRMLSNHRFSMTLMTILALLFMCLYIFS